MGTTNVSGTSELEWPFEYTEETTRGPGHGWSVAPSVPSSTAEGTRKSVKQTEINKTVTSL